MLDVLILGGGPTGLQAALTLGRAQRKALVLDAGPPRNARAVEVHNFLTRDGTPPSTLRALAREELSRYGVEVRGERAVEVSGAKGAFVVRVEGGGEFAAKRVILAGGMIDHLPPIPGLETLWGDTIFQCPYCHGHELRGRRWAARITAPAMVDYALVGRGWTPDLVALTEGRFEVSDQDRARLAAAGVTLDERPIAALRPAEGEPHHLGAVIFADGEALERDAMLLRPEQSQTPLVTALGLDLDPQGYVAVGFNRETSIPGIYAAGDLSSPMQAAIAGAASGMMTAAMLNHELCVHPS
jgi:thioredoxin reductase